MPNMKESSLQHIEMMNDLLKQARKVHKDYVNQVKEPKEDMLKKASAKIEKYFQEVVKVYPFYSVNVNVQNKISICIRLKGSHDQLINKKGIKVDESFAFIQFKDQVFYNEFYTLFIKHEGCKWYQWNLNKLDEKAILLIIKHFDEIRSSVEETMQKEIQEHIEGRAKGMQQESENISTLEEFIQS